MNVYKAFCSLVCAFAMWSAVLPTAHAVEITADAAILIEASTGRVIYQKNADEHMYPASTTKMMTAILALERANMNDVVRVSSRAAMVEDFCERASGEYQEQKERRVQREQSRTALKKERGGER